MSTMVRWFIKSALAYLGAGFLLGGILLTYKALAHRAVPAQWVTIHVHLLLVGFMVQLVMGVGYWMFPRVRDHWFGEQWAAASWALLNLGLLLRFVSEPYLFGPWSSVAAPATTVSALLQVVAGLLFVAGMWPRIKGVLHQPAARSSSRGSAPRKDGGG